MLNTPMYAKKESIYYYINLGVDEARSTGFCVLLRYTIYTLAVADNLGLVSFVEWGKRICYYEKALESEIRNVFYTIFNQFLKLIKSDSRQTICILEIRRYRKL